jgi:Kef-type K+ transport system membrane component KefB
MALRHIVLLKVTKKEDTSIVVEELKKLRESLKPHLPTILSFVISENIGFVPSLLLISFLSTTESVSLGE